MTTGQRLIEVAGNLLDAGGEEAVTLRAVGQAAGLSHNAPYKHFASRSALLAAVATVSFAELAETAAGVRQSAAPPMDKLRTILALFIGYKRQRPARYALLFNNAETAAAGGDLKVNAVATYAQFRAVVEECQAAGMLPDTPSDALTSLIVATAQGLLGMEGNGALHAEKGLESVEASIELMLSLIAPTGR